MTDERREWLERVRSAAERAADQFRRGDDPHRHAVTGVLDGLVEHLRTELEEEDRGAADCD